MKPLKLSTNLNHLGEDMKHSKAFENLKKHDHSASFDGLGKWLDQNSKEPNTMRNIHKIAASLLITVLVLVACTVPLEHEEEIGYMIKGMAAPDAVLLKSKLTEIPELDPSQVSVQQVLHEFAEKREAEKLTEVVMVLPEADYQAAQNKRDALSAVFDFISIEILPIEDKVERTIFESALHKFDIKVSNEIPDSVLVKRIDQFIHEHSSAIETVSNVWTDENGVRFIELNMKADNTKLEIKYDENGNINYRTKKGVKLLINDLTPQGNGFIHEEMREQEVLELKEKELREKASNR